MKQEQVLKSVKNTIDEIIITEPELSIDKLFKVLNEKFGFQYDEDQFIATASEDPDNPDLAILEKRYNDTQLDILEDVYVNDWTANECIQKKSSFIWGRNGRTVLDTKLEYTKDKEKRQVLTMLYQNKRYIATKNQIDLLNCQEDIDLDEKGKMASKSCFVYGRGVIQIIRGEKPSQEELDSDTVYLKDNNNPETQINNSNLPIALKVLNSKRLGKTKVNMKTNKIIAVEYLDVKKVGADGRPEEVAQEDKYLDVKDLILFINDDGNVSTNAQFTGVSRLESIINISMVKRIIMNQNIKEAAKTHYAGILIAKFPPETETPTMTSWLANAAKAAGRWFAHRLNVAVQHFKVETDLDKYGALVELIDTAIIRAIGLPRSLVGMEQYSNYANLEQVLIAYREGELYDWRKWAKRSLQKYWLNPLFQELLPKQDTVSNKPPLPNDEKPPTPPTENPDAEEEQEYQIVITDEDVKISYEFQDISFLGKKEIIEGLKMLKELGVPLTIEMILRIAGYDEWVEEIMQEKQIEDKRKEDEAAKRLQDLETENAMMKNGKMPMQSNNQFPFGQSQEEKNNPVAAANESTILNATMLKYNELTDEKIKTLKAIQLKLEMLN